jgi:hypothetical protein
MISLSSLWAATEEHEAKKAMDLFWISNIPSDLRDERAAECGRV